MKYILILLFVLALAGCSQRAVYDNLQLNHRQQCEQGPPAAYEECMEKISKSYEQYARERQEHLEAREKEAQKRPAHQ